MRTLLAMLVLALAMPAAAQDRKPKKPAARAPAHAKPTPQQIRRFNELEKKEEKKQEIRGRSPNSKRVPAPSPK